MVEIKGLCKRYGKFTALDHLDLKIAKGELFGFVGPNGAGKTTTMRILSGLLRADEGQVTLDGIDALRNSKQIKVKIGYMPDFFGVYDNLRVMEYMEFYAATYGFVGEEAKRLCRELLALVNLEDRENSLVDGLSRGMKQRLCLARSLVHNPNVLILDEPASGLDPRARFEMKGILSNLNEMGKTIIISSHILPELAQMCTTIGIIEKGSMVIKGSVSEIMSHLNSSNPIVIKLSCEQEKAVRILKENPFVRNIVFDGQCLTVNFDGEEEDEMQILKNMVQNDIPVISFYRQSGNLEEVFMKMTGQKEVLQT